MKVSHYTMDLRLKFTEPDLFLVIRLVISTDFSLKLTIFFFWKALNPFFGAQDEGFLKFCSR